MKKHLKLAMLAVCVALAMGVTAVQAQQPEKKLGWYLSAQTYTFNRFTFFEAVDKTLGAGLNSVEAFNGQEIGGGIEGKMDYKMDAEKRKAILKALKKKKVKLCAFGVVNGTTDEEWRQLFEFAKAMDIKVINSEPNAEFLPLIGQLANQYKIKVGIHNHPNPTKYWDPAIVLDAIAKANSEYVGACADIGHWVRSGLDPIESLKKYEGHLVSLHFKDLEEKSPKTHDVPWGTGVCNVEGVIAELKRQGFKGNISAEYEYNWDNNAGDVAQSVANFRALLAGK
ncbi:sugar phosphate isomerase/epimerase family protein [Parapedobacter koreensis]|uniref:Sugar phosphate isomerase/epimerase n=1 Tax=Parapedobacter koreensis TaxID=332977 RepID=A0A1H7L998_9SPHI|nr:sugar phosphate isomerase/epimerase [Parapedobacter koreensis]SEK95623.1 Sugar phosphate isomerase/epimerase [Parapedobacter koreensis]